MHDPGMPARQVKFGPYELDVRSGELKKGPTRLRVPDQSIEILKALLEQPGELVTREQLRERLWPSNTFVDFEHGLNAAIRRLREALGDSADAPEYIETLPRRGYRFIGSIEGAPAFIAAPTPEPDATLSQQGEGGALPPALSSRSRPGVRHLILGVSIVLFLGIGLFVARRSRESPSMDPSTTPRSIPVTSLPGLEIEPSVSPDGTRVAFASDAKSEGNFDIYVKLLDIAGEPQALTTNAADDRLPAWSPDGTQIAFVRSTTPSTVAVTGSSAVVVPALPGPERVLDITGIGSALSWTPDGKALVFAGRSASSADATVFLYYLETGEQKPLTPPIPGWRLGAASLCPAPVVSPDSKYLAFIRSGTMGNVFIQRLEADRPVGEPQEITHEGRASSLAWTPDSSSIFYDIGGHPGWGGIPRGLWRVPITGGNPQAVYPNARAVHPSVDRDGRRLVYQSTTSDRNIWRVPGPLLSDSADSPRAPQRLIESSAFDMAPQFSRDGGRIVFVSARSGEYEIWVSGSDGQDAIKLTSFNGAPVGSPRWSPNGDFIAFDSFQSGTWNVYVVGANRGPVRPLTIGTSRNVRPSWSKDGRWIYFSSERSGDAQIWKIPRAGGEPRQVTKKGGLEGFESPDGRHLYYTKQGAFSRGVWRVPVEGGDEVQVIDHGTNGSWAVTDGGIVIMDKFAKPAATLEYFSFESARITWTRQLPAGLRFDRVPSFTVSRDGRWILYTQYDNWGSDIHMLQGPW